MSAEYLTRNWPSDPKTNAEFSDSPFFKIPYLTGRLHSGSESAAGSSLKIAEHTFSSRFIIDEVLSFLDFQNSWVNPPQNDHNGSRIHLHLLLHML